MNTVTHTHTDTHTPYAHTGTRSYLRVESRANVVVLEYRSKDHAYI